LGGLSGFLRVKKGAAMKLWIAFVILQTSLLAQDKFTVPNVDARKKASSEVKEIYGKEFSEANISSKKIKLAKKLLQEGIATKNNPNSRYVIFRISKDIAASAGDADTAFTAIDQMGKFYKIDAFTLKIDALKAAAKHTKKDTAKAIVEKATGLIEDSVKKDDYDLAKELGKIALAAARKVRDFDSAKKIVERNKEIKAIAQEYEKIKPAFKTLETNPTDSTANQSVGMFYCLAKGNWDGGLHMLVLGNDATLKSLAMKELKKPKAADFLVLGNGWWEQAEKADGLAQKQLQAHAAIWYRKALPNLTGIDKTKIAKRLAQTQQPERWISKNATYKVSSIDRGISGNPLPSLLNESQKFYDGSGFAFHTNPEAGSWITIDLGKQKRITRVFILNRQDNRQSIINRAVGMSLYVSADGKQRQKMWTATQGLPQWNVQLSKPIEGRYVTLQLPIRAAEPKHFHLKKVMVFGQEK
jgi:hypothetical protein